MLISGTVNISAVGGMIAAGENDSAIVVLGPEMILGVNPNLQNKSTSSVSGGMGISPQASVIHSGEVSINEPSP